MRYIKYINLKKSYFWGKPLDIFDAFRKQFLLIASPCFNSFEGIKNKTSIYDAYICGSDQVWNPTVNAGVDPAYYLDFAPKGCKRIAYAASFGRNDIEAEYHSEIARLLKKMDAISMREKSGVDFVSSLTGQSSVWLPDPTMLVDDYNAVTTIPKVNNYAFLYTVRELGWAQKAKNIIAHKIKLPVIDSKSTVMSPNEWVGYIKQAKFLVTNSFHGVVFGIIFQRPFVAIGFTGGRASLNDRISSLLGKLGLEGRMLKEYNEDAILRLINEPIDWEKVHLRIQDWRNEAYRYLTKVLSGD